MMIRKILSFAVVVTLLVFAGTACKKKADGGDDKPYLIDQITPNDGTKPCIDKGAVGVMGLMLKGDCGGVKVPVCGNSITETGEQCDPPDGKNCSNTCQKIPITNSNGGNSTVSIDPKTINNGKAGVTYISETITAKGAGKGDSYDWSAPTMPEGFLLKPIKNGVRIVSVGGAKYKKGGYLATVKACLHSKSADCATQSYSFEITDQYTIGAYAINSPTLACTSSDSCAMKIAAADIAPLQSVGLNSTSVSPYRAIIRMQVNGASEQSKQTVELYNPEEEKDLYYQWAITEDGKASNALSVDYVPVVDKATGHSVHPEQAYLLVDTSKSGNPFKNVTVTVTSPQGGKQSLTFSSITLPSQNEIKAAEQEAANKADACYGKAGPTFTLTENGKDVTGKVPGSGKSTESHFDVSGLIGGVWDATIKIVGGVAPYKVGPVEVDSLKGASFHTTGNSWYVDTVEKDSFVIKGDFKYIMISAPDIVETMRVKVLDSCGKATTVILTFTTKIPAVGDEINSKIWAHVHFSWSNANEKDSVRVELVDSGQMLIAASPEIAIKDWDGDTYLFKCDDDHLQGYKSIGCSLDGLDEARVRIAVPYAHDCSFCYDLSITIKDVFITTPYHFMQYSDPGEVKKVGVLKLPFYKQFKELDGAYTTGTTYHFFGDAGEVWPWQLHANPEYPKP